MKQVFAKIFNISWRAAILLLPWQTRFFWDAQLAGWPWEQGRISVYASWIPVIAAIVLGLSMQERQVPNGMRKNLFWIFTALGLCTLVAAPTPSSAAIQWWIQVFLLSAFFLTLYRAKISTEKIIIWFLFSLIPHALLALSQSVFQVVWASKWLGISGQDPASLGVSVVQTAAGRFLRAYGGFPHPNILGGWMAIGILVSAAYAQKLDEQRACLMSIIAALFSIASFYSFSRSAWLAMTIGLIVALSVSFPRRRKSGNPENKIPDSSSETKKQSNNFFLLAIPFALFFVLTIVHHDLVFTRFTPDASRLERKSVSTRMQTLRDGVEIYKANILFGTGPNSELPMLARLKGISSSTAPLEPPHMVWLLTLVDFGTVGVLFVGGLMLFMLRKLLEVWRRLAVNEKALVMSLVLCLSILFSLDHYPWSYWSGQAIVFVALAFVGLNISEKTQ